MNIFTRQQIEKQFQRGMDDAAMGRSCHYGCHFGMRRDRWAYMDAYVKGYNIPRKMADAHVIAWRQLPPTCDEIEVWYNRQETSWVCQLKDRDGCQIGGSYYNYHKKDATDLAKAIAAKLAMQQPYAPALRFGTRASG